MLSFEKKEKIIWNDVQVWQQKPVAKEKRVGSRLGNMVRQANNQS